MIGRQGDIVMKVFKLDHLSNCASVHVWCMFGDSWWDCDV